LGSPSATDALPNLRSRSGTWSASSSARSTPPSWIAWPPRVRSEPLRRMPAVLLVDKTGVGAAVLDSFTHARIGAVAITLHGGSSVARDPQRAGFRVPKRDLVTVTQVLLQNGRLRVAAELPEAETLKRELLNFRVKIDPKTAHDSYEHWREAEHDDLVLAVSMAAWFRQYWNRHLDAGLPDRLRRTNAVMGVGAM
jgi:hypothetical protein